MFSSVILTQEERKSGILLKNVRKNGGNDVPSEN